MLGLRRGTVEVVAHVPAWAELFERERALLQACIGVHVTAIEHVGSTSVPDLAAKPILDIAVAVASRAAIAACRAPLVAAGYIDRGDAGEDGGYLFVKESAPDVRTHHLHIVTHDDAQWRNYLHVRDALRADPVLRTRYAELKRVLQQRFAGDRRGYTAAKHTFIEQLLQPT